ncbi:MAG TPA: [FeFe] hydrogenase H-cluster maturation GTPase HydF, partial [Ruminococcaceae bacterium]|nr:[FeFe] hydrogenase H-cluster maturation GTPase HydF [Oscillospiraceae bacterium]
MEEKQLSDFNSTPRSNRLHIGIFGRRNAGKSTLINAICGHQTAVVSDVAGTTTDPVYKSMEIHGLGPCVLIDTAGFDDEGKLGRLRMEKTKDAAAKTDVAILLFDADIPPDDELEQEKQWLAVLRKQKTPVLAVISKSDTVADTAPLEESIYRRCKLKPVPISAAHAGTQSQMRELLLRLLPEGMNRRSIAGHLVNPGDIVLLVMPQNIQAPEGRLILPQVQTIRDLLDHLTVVMSVTADRLDEALSALKKPPALIITDSQVFSLVYQKKPKESRLTSFSILMSGVKGDVHAFIEGAQAVDKLRSGSRVLIAEACTHVPLQEDIGRV